MTPAGFSYQFANTASLAAMMPGGGPYGVTKHGVVALTEGLKSDLVANKANISASVLCPGFVDTNIFDAERNRPDNLDANRSGDASAQTEMMKRLLAAGKQPGEIADIVFRSIEEDNLYILPHPAWDDRVRARVELILARGGLLESDMEEVIRRQQKGEKF